MTRVRVLRHRWTKGAGTDRRNLRGWQPALYPTLRDSFDRMLIAQSQIEGLTLVSDETLFDRFGTKRLW